MINFLQTNVQIDSPLCFASIQVLCVMIALDDLEQNLQLFDNTFNLEATLMCILTPSY